MRVRRYRGIPHTCPDRSTGICDACQARSEDRAHTADLRAGRYQTAAA